WVFLAAAVSDAVDGIVAKHFDAETVFGAYLDPIADKALLVSVYVVLGYEGHLPNWLVILVVFRDMVIVGGALLFHTITLSLSMRPLMISKVNTFLQLVLATAVLAAAGYHLGQDQAIQYLGYVVAVTTLVSLTVYVVKWSQRAAAIEDAGTGNPEEPK
ncbi:MAG: CDP-alcohol phosphatidyltransferase family protein, partial [Rhodospirillales bacterium]